MSANINPYKRANQLTKLDRMLDVIAQLETMGVSKQESLAFWRRATTAEWNRLALIAGIRPPKTTKPMLLEKLAERAECS
jgi:hypothetical protein